MSPTIRSLVIPVSDLDAAKAVYTALLGAPHTDQPYYVGYNVDGFEVSLAPGDVAGGPVAYADVEDLDATRATLLAAGATERSAPRQVAPEARVCVLADADGNPIGLRGGSRRCRRGALRQRPSTSRSPGSRAGSCLGSASTAQSERFHSGTGVRQSLRGTNRDRRTSS